MSLLAVPASSPPRSPPLRPLCSVLKAAQRDRAARYPAEPDPLTDEVAGRLVDRMEDCTRRFPRALVLGGAGLAVLHALRGGRGGVEAATLVDTSQGMLDRARREWAAATAATPGPTADFVLADAERELLPVDPGTYDVVISCLGLHWVNDVPVSPAVGRKDGDVVGRQGDDLPPNTSGGEAEAGELCRRG